MSSETVSHQSARAHIAQTCGNGWLTLVDVLFDNKPAHIQITRCEEKYGELDIRIEGQDPLFEELVLAIQILSAKTCQLCGASGKITVIDGWQTALCRQHFETSQAREKHW